MEYCQPTSWPLGEASNLDLPNGVEVLRVQVQDANTIRLGLSQQLEAELPALVAQVERLQLECRDA